MLGNVRGHEIDRRGSHADVYLILSSREGIENKHEGQYTRGSKEKCFELAHADSVLKQSGATQAVVDLPLDTTPHEVVAGFNSYIGG